MGTFTKSPFILGHCPQNECIFLMNNNIDDVNGIRCVRACTPCTCQPHTIVALDTQVDTNVEAFNRVPERFLERLVELLTVPLQGCDVLVPSEAVTSEDWLEYNGRVMHPVVGGVDVEVGARYFFTEAKAVVKKQTQ